jgi:hypothetical protein
MPSRRPGYRDRISFDSEATVIVIVARETDPVARSLAAQWADQGAALLTPSDLSLAGWRHGPTFAHEDSAVVSKREVSTAAVTGILTRLRCVVEHDLAHITPEDRSFVASEMTAFLLSWLDEFNCPLLNRPTSTCLSGPGWRAERWTRLVHELGIPVFPVRRHAKLDKELPSGSNPESLEIATVIGDLCLGTVDATLAQYAHRVADAAGVALLGVRFSEINGEFKFLDADPWPDISSVQTATAVYDYLCGRVPCQIH